LKYFDELCTMNRGLFWRFMYWIKIGNDTKKILAKTFKPNDSEAVAICREKLCRLFKELDQILLQRKSKYLGGDTVGVADIALAALGAPLVNPPLYCGGKFGKVFDAFLENDAEAKAETNYWRETVTGKYILELYQSHRLA